MLNPIQLLISRFTKNSGVLEDWPSWHNCAGYGRIYMTGEFSEHSVDAEDGQHEHSNGIFVVTTVFGNPVIGVATDYHGDVDEYPIMLAVAEDTKDDLLYWYDDLQDFEQVEAVFKRKVSTEAVPSNSSRDDGEVESREARKSEYDPRNIVSSRLEGDWEVDTDLSLALNSDAWLDLKEIM